MTTKIIAPEPPDPERSVRDAFLAIKRLAITLIDRIEALEDALERLDLLLEAERNRNIEVLVAILEERRSSVIREAHQRRPRDRRPPPG